MNEPAGAYVPPDWTMAVPTTAPPASQELGGELCGPNTETVIVPPAWAETPVSAAANAEPGIAVPVVPTEGALRDRPGAVTTVSGIAASHAELAGASPRSPP